MTAYPTRAAAAADAAALYVFGELLLGESSFFIRSPGERARSVDEMRQIIERFSQRPHYTLLSAWDGGKAVGEALVMGGDLKRNRLTGIVGLGVLAAYEGQGLGHALMTEAESFARAQGLHRLELTVMAHNAKARHLYDAMGYIAEGRKRDSLFVDGHFVDEIIMAKILA